MRARQALSFAIDRRRLVALVGKQGAVTCQILPPNFDAYARYCPFTAGPTAGVCGRRPISPELAGS